MRKTSSVLLSLAAIAFLGAGCAGPERKLGRGLSNMAEPIRMGEFSRSYEQSTVFSGSSYGSTTGIIHGVNRTFARFGTGVYEVLTFPIPNYKGADYGPVFYPEGPVYPDSHHPNIRAESITSPDTNLGFAGGDIAPFIPGCRFHIFDN